MTPDKVDARLRAWLEEPRQQCFPGYQFTFDAAVAAVCDGFPSTQGQRIEVLKGLQRLGVALRDGCVVPIDQSEVTR